MKSKQKKVSAQSAEYVKGYHLQSINESKLLSAAGLVKRNGKYYNKASIKKQPFKSKLSAYNFAAKKAGWKNYEAYKKVRKTRVYKQFEKRATDKGNDVVLGSDFSKLFREWEKTRYTKKSQQLRTLLRALGWLDEHNYSRYV